MPGASRALRAQWRGRLFACKADCDALVNRFDEAQEAGREALAIHITLCDVDARVADLLLARFHFDASRVARRGYVEHEMSKQRILLLRPVRPQRFLTTSAR